MKGRMGYIKLETIKLKQKALRCGVWFPLLLLIVSGCGYIIKKEAYVKDQKLVQTKVEFIRKQMHVQTRILQNHGRSINEIRLQLRGLGSRTPANRVKGQLGDGKKKPMQPMPVRTTSRPKRRPSVGHSIGKSLFIRAIYRGLPLNYAAGYRKPRGKRYPYRLPPGTLAEVLSTDLRGFTRVRIKSGRWKGRRMWVRTRWLVAKMKSRSKSGSR